MVALKDLSADADQNSIRLRQQYLAESLHEEQGLDPDPYGAFARSGYAQRVAAERVGGVQASWGA